MGQIWDKTGQRAVAAHRGRRLADQLQQIGHLTLACAATMFIVSVLMRWLLTDTDLLALASRALPIPTGGAERETLNAGNATQILDMLTVALPALMIMLISAGALHRSVH